jgi:putative transposase
LETLIERVLLCYGVEQRELCGASRRQLLAEGRGVVVAWLAVEHRSASLTEVARRFGRDISATSLVLRRIMEQARQDTAFHHRLLTLHRETADNSMTQARSVLTRLVY